MGRKLICMECEGIGTLDRRPTYAERRQIGFLLDGTDPCLECGGRGFYSARKRRERVPAPFRDNEQAEAARALDMAALARLTLQGRHRGEGFWLMPHGRDFVLTCWRNNLSRARALRQSHGRRA